MNEDSLDFLRLEMIAAFHEFVSINSLQLNPRMQAWDIYCEKREAFLQRKCYEQGMPYVALKATIVDGDTGRTYKRGG